MLFRSDMEQQRARYGGPLGNCGGSHSVSKAHVEQYDYFNRFMSHYRFTIINDDTASPTIPHLKLAQDGTSAPASVGSIDNTLLNAATRRVDGAVNTALAPGRALFGF